MPQPSSRGTLTHHNTNAANNPASSGLESTPPHVSYNAYAQPPLFNPSAALPKSVDSNPSPSSPSSSSASSSPPSSTKIPSLSSPVSISSHSPVPHMSSPTRSSTSISPPEPPLPPPGFQPPVAFNPAAQGYIRKPSGESGSGSSGGVRTYRSGSSGEACTIRSLSGSGGREIGERKFGAPSPTDSTDSTSSSQSRTYHLNQAPVSFRPTFQRESSGSSATSSQKSEASVSPYSSPRPTRLELPEVNSDDSSGAGSPSSSSSRGSPAIPQSSSAAPSTSSRNSSGLQPTASANPQTNESDSSPSVPASASSSPIDRLSPNLFLPPALNPPGPPRSNSDAWDSVWPAVSPYSVPHLPVLASKSNASSPTLSMGGLGSPMHIALSPSSPFPPGFPGSSSSSESRSSAVGHRRSTSINRSPSGGSPLLGTALSFQHLHQYHQPFAFPLSPGPRPNSPVASGSGGHGRMESPPPLLNGMMAPLYGKAKEKRRSNDPGGLRSGLGFGEEDEEQVDRDGKDESEDTFSGERPALQEEKRSDSVESGKSSDSSDTATPTPRNCLGVTTQEGKGTRSGHVVTPSSLLSLASSSPPPLPSPSSSSPKSPSSPSLPEPISSAPPSLVPHSSRSSSSSTPTSPPTNSSPLHPSNSLSPHSHRKARPRSNSNSKFSPLLHQPKGPSFDDAFFERSPPPELKSPRPVNVSLPPPAFVESYDGEESEKREEEETQEEQKQEQEQLAKMEEEEDQVEDGLTPSASFSDESPLRDSEVESPEERDEITIGLDHLEAARENVWISSDSPSLQSPASLPRSLSHGKERSIEYDLPEPEEGTMTAAFPSQSSTLPVDVPFPSSFGSSSSLHPGPLSPDLAASPERSDPGSFFPPQPPPAISPPLDNPAGGNGFPQGALMGAPGPAQMGRDGYLAVSEDMDLEDEGLTTLERIFLLSKSEFAHHRIFISKVIGDWVEDVDPCETVEYVLPLLNSLGTDEDESVREALAPSLHKILWFFFSSCHLVTEEEEAYFADEEQEESECAFQTAVTVTSEGIAVVPKPTPDENANYPSLPSTPFADSQTTPPSAGSIVSGPSTQSTLLSNDTDGTALSDFGTSHPFGIDYDDGGKSLVQPVLKDRPMISVQTFTPLIGSLLMSQSSIVCDSAKAAIIGIIARLRDKQLPTFDPWPERHTTVGEEKTYYAQTGLHVHRAQELSPSERKIIENELIQAIVIGMSRLDETQSPYDNEAGDVRYVEEDGEYEDYGWPEVGEDLPEPDPAVQEDGDLRNSPPETNAFPSLEHIRNYPPMEGSPASLEAVPSLADSADSAEFELDEKMPEEQSPTAHEVYDYFYPTTNFDSPNAPPENHRSLSEEDLFRQQALQGEASDIRYSDEMAMEASHGRLLSMNLIATVIQCGVLEGEDVIFESFVEEVVRVRKDESFSVRREATLAIGELLKVVSQEVAASHLFSVFNEFARDESPHVRQAACLALPSLAKHLSPPEHRHSHCVELAEAFFNDEVKEVQNTALEVLGELIHAFYEHKEEVPREMIQHFLGPPEKESKPKQAPGTLSLFAGGVVLGYDEDRDYRPIVCSFNFPAVALSVGPKGWPLISDYYQELSTNNQVQVRRSLAASLHEMAQVLGNEIAAVDLVPFFRRCLDDVQEVRERLWENLHVFIATLNQETAWPLIHQIGELLVQGRLGNWRVRERLMTLLPDMAESMVQGDRGNFLVVSLLREGLTDGVAAVRDAAVKVVPDLYATSRKLDSLETRNALDQVAIVAMIKSSSYRQRLTCLKCISCFIDLDYNHDIVRDRIFPILLNVVDDCVVDVRLYLAKLVARICAPGSYCPVYAEAAPEIVTVAESLRNDESFDVREIIAAVVSDAPPVRRPSAMSSTFSSRPNSSRASSSNSFPVFRSEAPSPTEGELSSVDEASEIALRLENVPAPDVVQAINFGQPDEEDQTPREHKAEPRPSLKEPLWSPPLDPKLSMFNPGSYFPPISTSADQQHPISPTFIEGPGDYVSVNTSLTPPELIPLPSTPLA